MTGDFNSDKVEIVFESFRYHHDLKNLFKNRTCFKNPEQPRCITLFLTNGPLSFQYTTQKFAGLFNFPKMILTVFKTTFTKSKSREIKYRDYKAINQSNFENELKQL